MTDSQDLENLIVAAHTLTRVAAIDAHVEAPAAQLRALTILRDRSPLRIGELARLIRTTQPGTTRLVATMTELGLVAREIDPDDTRAVRIRITEAGERAHAAWRDTLTTTLLPRFSHLTDDEWSALRATSRILTSLAATDQPRQTDPQESAT